MLRSSSLLLRPSIVCSCFCIYNNFFLLFPQVEALQSYQHFLRLETRWLDIMAICKFITFRSRVMSFRLELSSLEKSELALCCWGEKTSSQIQKKLAQTFSQSLAMLTLHRFSISLVQFWCYFLFPSRSRWWNFAAASVWKWNNLKAKVREFFSSHMQQLLTRSQLSTIIVPTIRRRWWCVTQMCDKNREEWKWEGKMV